MSDKPTLFIGSSVEGQRYAYAIQELLDYAAAPTVWDQGIFTPTSTTMESLMNALDRFDFAAFILSPDDIVQLRDQEFQSSRDNVVFELGLFIGRLGRQRCFIVMPRDIRDFHLPSDLLGTTPVTFDGARTDEQGALGPVANKIRRQIEAVGRRSHTPLLAGGPGTKSPLLADDRLTVWVIGSYTNLAEKDRIHAEKLVSILAKGFANIGIRVVMGQSNMLSDFAQHYRDAAFASLNSLPPPIILPGTLRRGEMREVFVDAIGRVPDIALVIGGNPGRTRVLEESESANAAGIPVLAMSSTGGAAAGVNSTLPIAPELLKIISDCSKPIGSGDLAVRVLEAFRTFATTRTLEMRKS